MQDIEDESVATAIRKKVNDFNGKSAAAVAVITAMCVALPVWTSVVERCRSVGWCAVTARAESADAFSEARARYAISLCDAREFGDVL